MEIKREKLRALSPLEEPRSPTELRVRQLRARDLLRGDLEGPALERHVTESVLTTTLDRATRWGRANSIFPATFGLACCAIEMMSIVSPRYDIARFGAENMRASPRQADMLILSGRVAIKMAPVIRRLYDQMLEPKWVIAMGACSSSSGVFNNYALVTGADKFMPVDVHVPGCPPRPEALIHGILKLQRKVSGHSDMGWRERYEAEGTGDDQQLAHLLALHRIEMGACRRRFGRALERADLDFHFTDRLRSDDAGQRLHAGADRCDRAAGDGT